MRTKPGLSPQRSICSAKPTPNKNANKAQNRSVNSASTAVWMRSAEIGGPSAKYGTCTTTCRIAPGRAVRRVLRGGAGRRDRSAGELLAQFSTTSMRVTARSCCACWTLMKRRPSGEMSNGVTVFRLPRKRPSNSTRGALTESVGPRVMLTAMSRLALV